MIVIPKGLAAETLTPYARLKVVTFGTILYWIKNANEIYRYLTGDQNCVIHSYNIYF